MERSERQRLEAIKRHLQRDLAVIQELLRTAKAPQRLSDTDIKKRCHSIVAAVKKKGGKVTADQLREIVTKNGMPFSAVGSLVAGKYVKKDGKEFIIERSASTRLSAP
jgi:hypothetical protein